MATDAKLKKRLLSPIVVGISICASLLFIFGLFSFDQWIANEDDLIIDAVVSEVEHLAKLRAYEREFDLWTMREQMRHHHWNLRSTKLIFWLSMFISVSGIMFAFWQFAQAEIYERRFADPDEVGLKSQIADMSFKTRSVASFVLLLSVVYLFIYIKYLYPISYLPTGRNISSTEVSSESRDSKERPQVEAVETGAE